MPKWKIATVGFSKEPVTSMGGLKVIPDITVEEMDSARALIFILPGGAMWETYQNATFNGLLKRFHQDQILLAAICGATLALARAGLLRGITHTSNSLDYLKSISGYHEDSLYKNQLAVSSQNIITASGVGHIEFALKIIEALSIYPEEARQAWFHLFKNGILPT